MTQNPPNPDVSYVHGQDSIVLDISDLIPQDGDVLTWSASTDHWTSQAPAAGVTLPIAETDVTNLTTDLSAKIAKPGSPGANDLLEYVGGVWTNRTPAQVKSTLAITESDVSGLTSDLSTLTTAAAAKIASPGSPGANDLLEYVGGQWTNRTPAQVKSTLAITESDVSGLTTDLAAKAPLASPTFTGITTAPEFTASGLTGATAATRWVGGTASGAPVSGTFAVGDFVIDQMAAVWICTVAGSPGTWAQASPTLNSSATTIKPAGTTSAGTSTSVARADHAHSVIGKTYAMSVYRYSA